VINHVFRVGSTGIRPDQPVCNTRCDLLGRAFIPDPRGISRSFQFSLELKVPAIRRATRAALGSSNGWQQTDDSSQILPRRLVQCRVRAHQVADHVPRCKVQSAFRRRSHGQRDRTLRTKTDALGRRLLPRSNPDGLREHVYRHRFVSDFQLAIAAKTI
jgi:hypothetical protein